MEDGVGTIINKSSRDINYLIETNGIGLRIKFILVFYIFLRIVTIIRVAKDITQRTNSWLLQVICILIVTLLSPLIGLPIYLIIRPLHYKKDLLPRRESLTLWLLQCYNCNSLNTKDNSFCEECGEPLKLKCRNCENICSYNNKYCPHCWSPNFDS